MLIFNAGAFAGKITDISPQAKYSFQKEYPGAKYASWGCIKDENIYAVRFIYSNQAITAYYNEEGYRIAFARIVNPVALPSKVKERINGLYRADEIKSIQELVTYNKTCYFFEIEQNGIKRSIGIFSNGHFKK